MSGLRRKEGPSTEPNTDDEEYQERQNPSAVASGLTPFQYGTSRVRWIVENLHLRPRRETACRISRDFLIRAERLVAEAGAIGRVFAIADAIRILHRETTLNITYSGRLLRRTPQLQRS